MQKTIVIFRKWNRKVCGDGILALFPEEAADNDGIFCNSYEHVGQHSAADYVGCIAETRPALPREYRDLAHELRRIGYKLDIRKRATRKMHEMRRVICETRP